MRGGGVPGEMHVMDGALPDGRGDGPGDGGGCRAVWTCGENGRRDSDKGRDLVKKNNVHDLYVKTIY